jgi:hypothetical protein
MGADAAARGRLLFSNLVASLAVAPQPPQVTPRYPKRIVVVALR